MNQYRDNPYYRMRQQSPAAPQPGPAPTGPQGPQQQPTQGLLAQAMGPQAPRNQYRQMTPDSVRDRGRLDRSAVNAEQRGAAANMGVIPQPVETTPGQWWGMRNNP